MDRSGDRQRTIRQATTHQPLIFAGTNRLIEVTAPATTSAPVLAGVSAYVAQENFLGGNSPRQNQTALESKVNSTTTGCRIRQSKRQPGSNGRTHEPAAAFAFGPVYREGFSNCSYPPGEPRIYQWRLSVEISVDHLIDLLPDQRCPRNGSVADSSEEYCPAVTFLSERPALLGALAGMRRPCETR